MKKLFEAFKIRNLEINNRICVPPMVCFNWSDETGNVTQKNIEHYENIAKGGFGLVIVEATCVNTTGRLSFDQLGLWNDEQIAGFSKIAQAVHKESVPVIVQIHHAGVMSVGNQVVCPSNYTLTRANGEIKEGKELKHEEIKALEQDFISACIRAYKAGFDGVELHGCHNYLICQFLNNKVNKRQDEYGINPWLFVKNIYDEVRKNTSPDFIIGIRLGVFEPTLEKGLENAKKMEQIGIDFLNLSYGFGSESSPTCPEDFPYKDVIWGAGQIKKAVNIPCFAVNGIQNGEQAQGVLKLTDVDMVCIGRGVLVNYNWANDVKNGKDCGKCLYCPKCMWRIDSEKCVGKILYNRNKA